MLNDNHKEYLRNALVKSYVEEQESKFTSSTADGPLQIGCDPHAEIMSMYIIPFLPNYPAYVDANNANPTRPEDEVVINLFQEQAWDIMVEVEQELLDEMIDHLKKQFASISF